VVAADGRRFSLFASFFRVDVAESGAPQRDYTHFLTWALVDVDGGRYFPHTLLDRRAPDIALHDIDNGRGPRDSRLNRALREVVARGRVPLPDRLLTADASVADDRLALDYDGNRFTKRADGSYELEVAGHGSREGCRLRFRLNKPAVRHGDDGVVRGVSGEDMFYYFSPQCGVEGAILVDGAWIAASGRGWFDHEFGGYDAGVPVDQESKVGWNWLSAQLDNGYEVSAYDLFERGNRSIGRGRWVIVVDPAGERHAYSDFTFEPRGSWTSTRTFNEYPTAYELRVPAAGLSLDVTVAMPHQEMITVISAPAFWEGVVAVTGTMRGAAGAGQGFVERSGVSVVDTTDELFASVGRETRRAIDVLLPEPLSAEQAARLIGGREHFVGDLDLAQYSRTVLHPIRDIILRGGKAWRSYGVLVCMDLVGGQSQRFADWLALPELLHVGSLIIDDVQDDSDVRRGGPSCHKMYGQALAINAGCASYFLAQIPVAMSGLPQPLLVRIYDAYFDAVRAAHAGQALDINGLWHLMPDVVEGGDGALLERRVLATHRLKSAAPAGALARMATLIGGGTDEQAEGVGSLFESFGLAFQIIDDVLNLRGFEQNRKSRGEDITAGKITAPIAKAMGRLSRDERRRLSAILAARSSDPAVIREAVQLVDGCGALDACDVEARELVEAAWARVDPLVPDSQFKIRLRAFGWFVLDRYY
jgi:geranylgeranyl pyrophosphate synthase